MKKTTMNWIYTLVIIGVFLMMISGCKKKDDDSNCDIDGNVYHTVTIGTQTWMVENLKTTRYNDGFPIPLVTDSAAWSNLTTPGYCWNNNDAANKITYGALYNWFTINTGKLAPIGWHVPTHAEWETLITYLGGETDAGEKMKSVGTIETGTGLWYYSPNTRATNESGFTAVPAGLRYTNAIFTNVGNYCFWWSSSESNLDNAWNRSLAYNLINVYSGNCDKIRGFSVRCIRDI